MRTKQKAKETKDDTYHSPFHTYTLREGEMQSRMNKMHIVMVELAIWLTNLEEDYLVKIKDNETIRMLE